MSPRGSQWSQNARVVIGFAWPSYVRYRTLESQPFWVFSPSAFLGFALVGGSASSGLRSEVRGGRRFRLSASPGFCSAICDARPSLTSWSLASEVAMRISGHRTTSVFRRYRIVSTDEVLAALTGTESRLTTDPHNSKGNARGPIRKIVIVRKLTSPGTLDPAGTHST